MSTPRRTPGDQNIFALQAIGLFVGPAVLGYLISSTLLGTPYGLTVGGMAGGVAVVVFAYRRYGEFVGTRRNPGPDDYVLSRRERKVSLLGGAALVALAFGLEHGVTLFGQSSDGLLAGVLFWIPFIPGVLFFVRGLAGIDTAGD